MSTLSLIRVNKLRAAPNLLKGQGCGKIHNIDAENNSLVKSMLLFF